MKAASGGSTSPSDLKGKPAEGVRKYLEGLLWILEMYHHGYCSDFYFVLEKSLRSFASASLIAQFLTGSSTELLAPSRSSDPPMSPLTCAVCILPVEDAEKFLGSKIPSLMPLFASDHALLGEINSMEKCTEMAEYKKKVTTLQQEMMALRSLGRDDSKVKAQLTAYSQKIEQAKKGSSDVDVVPLWEINAEVQKRCSGKVLNLLDFSPDVTLVRSSGSEPLMFEAPTKSMTPVRCQGFLYQTGEWPRLEPDEDQQTAGDLHGGQELEFGEEEQHEVGEEDLEGGDELDEEPHAEEDALAEVPLTVGDEVEAYWPEDDTWLPATIKKVHLDGSLLIVWEDGGDQSDVPADYVRPLECDEAPPAKRARHR
mmetsp:Transcript_157673/g.279596  ORF Transcript_157673/g.279596 Transcript_157673/m.279596 type:complete len:369 (-) Transcript_157673:54-1160(-)